MARLLTAAEVTDFLTRHPTKAADVPPWGLLFHDAGRQIVVFKKVNGELILSDASDLNIGHFEQFPNGVPNAELTVIEGQFVVASLPAIVQNAVKETAATVAAGTAAVVNAAGTAVVGAAVGVGTGAISGSGWGTLFVLGGLALLGFIAWKARL